MSRKCLRCEPVRMTKDGMITSVERKYQNGPRQYEATIDVDGPAWVDNRATKFAIGADDAHRIAEAISAGARPRLKISLEVSE